MGTRYYVNLYCAYCGKLNENVYYALNFTRFKCKKCGKVNEITMRFETIRIKEKSEKE